MTEKYQPIPHRLKNMAVGGHVAGAEDIDAGDGKTQQDINADTYRKSETYSQTEVDNKDSLLQVDIDNVDDDLQATKVVLNNKVMEIGNTVYDTQPTLNSAAPVTSDGIYRKCIQAEVVVGDPQGNWSPSTAEDMFERCQRQIELLNGSDIVITADHTGVVSPDTKKIYREPAQDGESYTDWMYDGSWHDIATYTFPGTDNEPTEDSSNIITSGTIYDYCAVAGKKVGEI